MRADVVIGGRSAELRQLHAKLFESRRALTLAQPHGAGPRHVDGKG